MVQDSRNHRDAGTLAAPVGSDLSQFWAPGDIPAWSAWTFFKCTYFMKKFIKLHHCDQCPCYFEGSSKVSHLVNEINFFHKSRKSRLSKCLLLRFWNFNLSGCAWHLWKIFYPTRVFFLDLWTGSAKSRSRASAWVLPVSRQCSGARCCSSWFGQQLWGGSDSAFGVLAPIRFPPFIFWKFTTLSWGKLWEKETRNFPSAQPGELVAFPANNHLVFPAFLPALRPSFEVVFNIGKNSKVLLS